MKKFNTYFVLVTLIFFSFSTFHYSLHQLEHLNDIICLSTDKHFHKSENSDVCKDLMFYHSNVFDKQDNTFILPQKICSAYFKDLNVYFTYIIVQSARAPPFFVLIS
ncbi:MAG: hypothetical protein AB1304_10200 [Bacteroidota bacterium]